MTSLFELFRIGIGPSSSHTVGPMRAARKFVEELVAANLLEQTDSVTVDLYGSLAHTGKGHGTDRAILLGLMGELPEQVEPAIIEGTIAQIRSQQCIRLMGQHTIGFDPERDLSFRRNQVLPGHSNGMRFAAYNWGKQSLACRIFYSIGGGSLRQMMSDHSKKPIPFPTCRTRSRARPSCWTSASNESRSGRWCWRTIQSRFGSVVSSIKPCPAAS